MNQSLTKFFLELLTGNTAGNKIVAASRTTSGHPMMVGNME